MKIVRELTEEQEALVPTYIEKWRAKCVSTAPICRSAFEIGLTTMHEEIGMEPPHELIYYPSPDAIWRAFEDWKPKITNVLTQFWKYQIPLCDPQSMHRRWGPGSQRQAFNFAAKRYVPGPELALRESPDSDETSGTLIEKNLHANLWKRFTFQAPFDWRLVSFYANSDFKSCDDVLWKIADNGGESTCQVDYEDCCFLAPQPWLLRELACVDFCHSVLRIDRNERLYAGLEAIVESGSFCGVFGNLCVACERPCQIEIDGQNFRLVFPDDKVFAATEATIRRQVFFE